MCKKTKETCVESVGLRLARAVSELEECRKETIGHEDRKSKVATSIFTRSIRYLDYLVDADGVNKYASRKMLAMKQDNAEVEEAFVERLRWWSQNTKNRNACRGLGDAMFEMGVPMLKAA